MEFNLRCNILQCRALLSSRAVVTTCSHIFCENCATQHGLNDARSRVCPACDGGLGNTDDAVLTTLNPNEDYKTSVLSGLTPTTILDCASRGIAFFQYQAIHEIMYQDYLVKNMTDRYKTLDSRMDDVIAQANSQIQELQNRLLAAQADREDAVQKNQELLKSYNERNKAHHNLQQVYNKLKGRVSAVAVEDAAAHNVDYVLNSAVGHAPQRPPQAHVSSHRSPSILQQPPPRGGSGGAMRTQYQWEQQMGPGNASIATPAHRQPLGMTPRGNTANGLRHVTHRSSGLGPSLLQPTPARQVLRPIDPNGMPLSGHGISAGVKVGRQTMPQHISRGSVAGGRPPGGSVFAMR